jgi:hypothetical protein
MSGYVEIEESSPRIIRFSKSGRSEVVLLRDPLMVFDICHKMIHITFYEQE